MAVIPDLFGKADNNNLVVQGLFDEPKKPGSRVIPGLFGTATPVKPPPADIAPGTQGMPYVGLSGEQLRIAKEREGLVPSPMADVGLNWMPPAPEQIREMPKQTIFQKIKRMGDRLIKGTPESQIAHSQNIYAIANKVSGGKPTPEAIDFVSKNYENLIKDPKITGLHREPTTPELIGAMMILPVTSAVASHPLSAVAGIAGFMTLSEIENAVISKVVGQEYRFLAGKGLKELLPEDASQLSRDTIDIIDFIGKAVIMGSIKVKTKPIVDKFTKNIITEYNLPKKIYLSPKKIRSIFQTGEKISPEESQIVADLGLSKAEWRKAVAKGIQIEIPAEKIVTITDKPWWAKVKDFDLRTPQEPIVSVVKAGELKYGEPSPKAIGYDPTFKPTPTVAPQAPETALKSTIEKAGAEYLGIQKAPGMEDIALFNDPITKTTLTLPVSEVTEQAVGEKIKPEKQIDDFLYHGTSADIEGGKLSFGVGEIRKGGQSGGLFLSDNPQSAQTFGRKVYKASPEIKKEIIDLTKSDGVKHFEKYIGKTYKTWDGEMVTFTKQDFDSMFPNGKADFASVSQYPEVVEKVVKDLGLRGIAFNEYAGGVTGKTYQIIEGDVPIITGENGATPSAKTETYVDNVMKMSDKERGDIVENYYSDTKQDIIAEYGQRGWDEFKSFASTGLKEGAGVSEQYEIWEQQSELVGKIESGEKKPVPEKDVKETIAKGEVNAAAKTKPLTAEQAVKQGMSAEEWVESKIYYHGTNKKIKQFKFSTIGDLGRGYYFTPNAVDAQKFAWQKSYSQGGKQNIVIATLIIKNPLVLGKGADGIEAGKLYKQGDSLHSTGSQVEAFAKEKGYDSIINKGYGKADEILIFDNKNIKVNENLSPDDVYGTFKTKSQLLSEYKKAKGEVKSSAKVENDTIKKPTKKEINLLLRAEYKDNMAQYEALKENDFVDKLVAGELPAVEGDVGADTGVIDSSKDYFTPGVPLYKSGEWKSLPSYVRRRVFSRKGGLALDEVAHALGMTDNELFNRLVDYKSPEKPGMGDPEEIKRYFETKEGQAELTEMREMSAVKDISIGDLKKLIDARKAIKPKSIPEKIKKVYDKLKLAKEGEKPGAVPSEIGLLENIIKMEVASIKKAFQSGKVFTRGQIKEMQEQIIGAIEESGIPRAKMGTFMRAVKNIQTPNQLERQLPFLIERLKNINVDFEKRQLASHIKRISDAKNIPADYKDQIAEMLENLDMKVRKPGTIAKRESRSDWLNRQKDEGDFVFLPDEFWEGLPKKTLNNMTLEELREIDNAISMLVHAGRTKNKLLHRKEAIDTERFVNDIVDKGRKKIRIPETPPKGDAPLVGQVVTAKDRAKRAVGEYFSGHRKAEYILRHFGAGKVFEIMQQGKNIRETKLDQLRDAIRSSGRLLKNLAEVTKIEGVRVDLTREQMIGVALNSGNRGNIRRLLEGNKFTIGEIKKINAALSTSERQWVNNMFQLVDSQFADTITTTQKIAGFTPKKVAGKYFPIVADITLDKQARINRAKQDLFKEIFDVTFVQRGFTISRIGGRAPLQLNIMDVIWGHLEKVAHYNNMAIPIRDLQKIIHHPRFKSMVEDGLGESVYKELPRWLSDVAQPYQGAMEETGAMVATYLRHSSTAANLGLRLTVAAYQPFSLTLAMREAGLTNILSGLAEFMKNPKAMKEFVDARSIQMKTRGRFMDRDIRDLVGTKEAQRLIQGDPEKGRMLFYLIRQMDLVGAYPSWMGAYRKSMSIYGDKTKAARYADGVVRRTQPTGAVEDLARVMRGGAFQKMWTMFMTHFSNVHNSLVESLDDFKVAGRDPLPPKPGVQTQNTGEHPFRRYSDLGAALMLIWVIPSIITEFIKSGFRWDTRRMAKAVGIYPISGLFLVRDVVNYMVNGFGMETPALSGPKSIAAAVRTKKTQSKLKHAAKGVAQLTGKYPTQAVDTVMGGWDLIEGNTRDWRRLIYSEWALKPTSKKSVNTAKPSKTSH